MNSSGTRNATIGDTFTFTTWLPGSSRTGSPPATGWSPVCCAWMKRNARFTFLPTGGSPGANPYFTHLYRVGFAGEGLTLLTPEDANHEVAFSPSGRYFVDTYSRPDVPPVTVLRQSDGKLVATIEKADDSRLRAAGWNPPQPITVKGRDGVTNLYGLMFTPAQLDPHEKYPIINHIYPGPQGGSVGSWSFAAARGDTQALAELGFVVVEIEGMGNPLRSKKFHDFYYREYG